ncbi:LysM peptidoglycan-binding domain-containing protein [Gottfriedia sp. OAE603]|uniref:LysM peptidoglycan-binding domain-containing protein n=1 Tax=Gottfriedia sp. OAE603 TaxID=2663872 RepID=UPI001789FA4E
MSSENQTNIRFSLKETVWFQKGQEVKEVRSLSLNPDITIQQFDEYVQVKGVLTLEGNYTPDQVRQGDYFSLRELAPSRLVEDVRSLDDGSCELRHQFPVDISIPLTRITDLENLCVSVETFDYQLTERGCIQIAADLCISGLHDNRAVEYYQEQREQNQYNHYNYSNDYRSSNEAEAEEQQEDREFEEQFQFFNQQPVSTEVNDKEDLYGSDWIQSLESDNQQEEDPTFPRQPTYLEVFQTQSSEIIENQDVQEENITYETQAVENVEEQSAEQYEEVYREAEVNYVNEEVYGEIKESYQNEEVYGEIEESYQNEEVYGEIEESYQNEEVYGELEESHENEEVNLASQESNVDQVVYQETREHNVYETKQNEATSEFTLQPSFLNNEVNPRQSFLNNEFTTQQPSFLNNEAVQQPSFLNNEAVQKPSFLNNDFAAQQNNSYNAYNTQQQNPFNVQNDIQSYEEQYRRAVEQSYQPFANNQYQQAPFNYNQHSQYQNPYTQGNPANLNANDVRQTPPYYAEYYQAQVSGEALNEVSGENPNEVTNAQEEAKEARSVKSDNLLSSLFAGEGKEESYTKMKLYLAQNGDTIETVAKKYNLQTQQLNRVNNLNDEFLSEGQIIYIPVTAIKQ